MEFIDLRSDTVTHPTEAMRQAMANAKVGDDVFGEDPTVNKLQMMAAEKMGKQAGLFLPSGTMGNLAAILAHCGRGDEVILGNKAHTFLYEAGGVSALGGVHSCQLPNQPDGTLLLQDIQAAIRSVDAHQPISRLVCLENTHNRCGAVALNADYTREVGELAHQRGLLIHLDGARIFNAAVVLGVSAKVLAEPADSVTFCLSKGLSAPVGSVLCGSSEFISKALRIRKQLGGGMRQAGILAAAGVVALETMIERLAEDHMRARSLAQGLSFLPWLVMDVGTPYTNMIFMTLADDFPADAKLVAGEMAKLGVKVGVVGNRRFRLVTHYWIDDLAVDKAILALKEVGAQLNSA
jgi:threonine aldolase